MDKSVEMKHADTVFAIMAILFVVATVIIVGCNLYRVFIVCTDPVSVLCTDVQELGNEVTWSGVIDDISYTWVEERTGIAIGDTSTIYISDNGLRDGADFTTSNERLFWVIALCIVLSMGCALIYTVVQDR